MRGLWRFLLLAPGVLLSGGKSLPVDRGFLEEHWRTPVPFQGEDLPGPGTCGQCHPQQLADWSASHHAKAFSPGLAGQLEHYGFEQAGDCLACHAPLAEQQEPFLEDGAAAIDLWLSDPGSSLTGHGVFCAVCHLRKGRILGPPPGKVGVAARPAVAAHERYHARSQPRPEFEQSLFCAPCHQFSRDEAVNGKPLENTYQEWLDSPYAREGVHCQGCHMPERRHLFRGIHDPLFVRKGLTITTTVTEQGAVLTLRSTGVGHRFPTYVVPRITLSGVSIDVGGRPVAGSRRETIIQRRVHAEQGVWQEVSDTRLRPGESATLTVPWLQGGGERNKIRFEVWVDPDHHYRVLTYPALLEELPQGESRRLIGRALAEAEDNRYLLFREEVDAP